MIENPEVHSFVYDEASSKVGEVMDIMGARVALRPPRGGCEWWAEMKSLRPPKKPELLKAKLAQVNHNSIIGFP
ncbi:hypothetical protein [Streptomyces sp. NPDC058045]|uniref:hypothetical protein n=1 Tax=Streptomyces sp. NPDC058045 TaxID=3346311 RepID=UPI0036E83786